MALVRKAESPVPRDTSRDEEKRGNDGQRGEPSFLDGRTHEREAESRHESDGEEEAIAATYVGRSIGPASEPGREG